MSAILYFIVIISACFGAGRIILNRFLKETQDNLENFIFSCGLGLSLLGYAVYLIGSAGFLYKKYTLLLLFFFALLAIYPVGKFWVAINIENALKSISRFSIFEKFLSLVLLSIAVISLFGAIAPETGNDALAYHLYHPKVFIQQHKIGYISYTRESLWPYLTEMLFTLGLILKNTALAKLFHYFFGVLSGFAVYAFVRRFFSKKEALIAAALFCSSPGIFMQSTYGYIDLAQCYYSLAAFYVLMLWHDKGDPKLLILSGIFTGLSLSVKIISGITLVALFILIPFILAHKKNSPKSILKTFFNFGIASFLACCIWYIRSYIVLQNPVYPFLHNIFGAGWETNISADVGMRKDIIGFLRLPWDIVMHLDSFGGEQIGVIFLAFLPVVLFVDFKNQVIRCLFLFLFFYTAIWFCIDPNIRFAFVNFAVVYMLIAIGLKNIAEKYRSLILKLFLSIMLLFNVCLCVYYNRDAIKLAFGITNEREYLVKKERTYPVAEFVNKNLSPNAVLITVGEPRVFYFNRKIIDYSIWREVSKSDFSVCVNKLLKDKIPVYLLCINKDNITDNQILSLLTAKSPVYEAEREINENVKGVYSLYKL